MVKTDFVPVLGGAATSFAPSSLPPFGTSDAPSAPPLDSSPDAPSAPSINEMDDHSSSRPVWKRNEPTSLYRAQQVANATVTSTWFPCYRKEYVQAQKGWKQKFIWVYSNIYDGALCVESAVLKVISVTNYVALPIFKGGKFIFRHTVGRIVSPVFNFVVPINPVNGKHHFVGVSRRVEKFLGDWIFYPMNTCNLREKSRDLSFRMAKVHTVLSSLVDANQALLNPKGETTSFDYRVKIAKSHSLNAFAVPGGGMVVFSELVKKLDKEINKHKINDVEVQFADGSRATVDVSGVTLEDTLAALLGHEMTHVASRHSMAALVSTCIFSALAKVGNFFLISYLKGKDEEYQKLKQIPAATRTTFQQNAIKDKEACYANISGVFSWFENKIIALSALLKSRVNEYEADVTGTFFARQAKFNPLGALYLQEVLRREENSTFEFIHKHLEVLTTHPYGENRKRAIFSAINEFDPQALEGKVRWQLDGSRYNLAHSSKAIRYAHEVSCAGKQ